MARAFREKIAKEKERQDEELRQIIAEEVAEKVLEIVARDYFKQEEAKFIAKVELQKQMDAIAKAAAKLNRFN
jgi:hypothetical protein